MKAALLSWFSLLFAMFALSYQLYVEHEINAQEAEHARWKVEQNRRYLGERIKCETEAMTPHDLDHCLDVWVTK